MSLLKFSTEAKVQMPTHAPCQQMLLRDHAVTEHQSRMMTPFSVVHRLAHSPSEDGRTRAAHGFMLKDRCNQRTCSIDYHFHFHTHNLSNKVDQTDQFDNTSTRSSSHLSYMYSSHATSSIEKNFVG